MFGAQGHAPSPARIPQDQLRDVGRDRISLSHHHHSLIGAHTHSQPGSELQPSCLLQHPRTTLQPGLPCPQSISKYLWLLRCGLITLWKAESPLYGHWYDQPDPLPMRHTGSRIWAEVRVARFYFHGGIRPDSCSQDSL